MIYIRQLLLAVVPFAILVSCQSKKEAVTTLQIETPVGTTKNNVIDALVSKSDPSTFIKPIPHTNLFEVGSVAKTKESAVQASDAKVSEIKDYILKIHPDWKVIIWKLPSSD